MTIPAVCPSSTTSSVPPSAMFTFVTWNWPLLWPLIFILLEQHLGSFFVVDLVFCPCCEKEKKLGVRWHIMSKTNDCCTNLYCLIHCLYCLRSPTSSEVLTHCDLKGQEWCCVIFLHLKPVVERFGLHRFDDVLMELGEPNVKRLNGEAATGMQQYPPCIKLN